MNKTLLKYLTVILLISFIPTISGMEEMVETDEMNDPLYQENVDFDSIDYLELGKKKGYAAEEDIFGSQVLTKEDDIHAHHIIQYPKKAFYEVPHLYEAYLKRLTSVTQEERDDVLITCSKGKKGDFFKFGAWPVGELGLNGKPVEDIVLDHREDDCFQEVAVHFEAKYTSVTVTITPKGKVDHKCKDTYIIGTVMNWNKFFLSKDGHVTKITFKKMSADQMEIIQKFGLKIYRVCDQFKHILTDLLMTVGLYLGGTSKYPWIPLFGSKPAPWQEKLNVEFIKRGSGYEWRKRKDVFVDLDETEVHPGDFLIITRMDGLDQLIQFGAGSISGHSVTLLELDGQLFAVESQDGWYWPQKHIQRTPWKTWKKWAQNAGMNVALLPLRPEIREKFNNAQAAEWFKTVEGLPYGYHNFLFGWLDVPEQNVPPVATMELLYVLFAHFEHMFFGIAKGGVQSLMGEALNQRLGTEKLSLANIALEAGRRNMTINDLFAVVEKDGWVYSDGQSMVCSAFVAATYQAGGLFGDMPINAVEFTPRDVYQLNFFDLDYTKPKKCQGVDDDLPYCQIMGQYKMDITQDGYSTVDPYPLMFERCESQAPLYNRTKGC